MNNILSRGGTASTYQMGNYINGEGKTEKGTVDLTGECLCLNQMWEASRALLQHWLCRWTATIRGRPCFPEPTLRAFRLLWEMFDAPAEKGRHLHVRVQLPSGVDPSTVDLSRKPFTILWAERRNGQFEVIQEMGDVVPTLFQSYPDIQMRLWDVTAVPDDLVRSTQLST